MWVPVQCKSTASSKPHSICNHMKVAAYSRKRHVSRARSTWGGAPPAAVTSCSRMRAAGCLAACTPPPASPLQDALRRQAQIVIGTSSMLPVGTVYVQLRVPGGVHATASMATANGAIQDFAHNLGLSASSGVQHARCSLELNTSIPYCSMTTSKTQGKHQHTC